MFAFSSMRQREGKFYDFSSLNIISFHFLSSHIFVFSFTTVTMHEASLLSSLGKLLQFHLTFWNSSNRTSLMIEFCFSRRCPEQDFHSARRRGKKDNERSGWDIALNSLKIYDSISTKVSVWNDLGHQSLRDLNVDVRWKLEGAEMLNLKLSHHVNGIV